MVSNEFKLCCSYKTRFGQATNCKIHHPNGGGNLALSHCGGIEKEWEVSNLHGVLKI
jgi:hypothetical protein